MMFKVSTGTKFDMYVRSFDGSFKIIKSDVMAYMRTYYTHQVVMTRALFQAAQLEFKNIDDDGFDNAIHYAAVSNGIPIELVEKVVADNMVLVFNDMSHLGGTSYYLMFSANDFIPLI